MPVSPEQVARFARSVRLRSPATVAELYWVARVTLVTGEEQIAAFDGAFAQAFRGLVDPADSRGEQHAPPLPPSRQPPGHRPDGRRADSGAPPDAGVLPAGPSSAEADDADDRRDRDVAVPAASAEERLASTDFAELTEAELRELYGLMREIRLAVPDRRTRRHRRHRRADRLDLRATLRRSRRTGGDPVDRVGSTPRRRPRPVVVLCDISGSMAPYSRAFVQLLHAAAGGSRAEVFTFATRLTPLTRALAVAQPDLALARAAAAAPDWRGGTRIASAVKAFLDGHGRRGVARGAVVVIVSDGWDRDDPAALGEQMARLRRLAHRIVWINPRSAAPGFAPLAGGMAAALPHCDALVSGHTLAALRDAVAALADK